MAPRCIVELRWGRLSGTKAVIRAGESLRVGRSERADLQVPHDAKLSNVHFELSWSGEVCRLRDLESTGGTLVGGREVIAEVVPHGGWIRAGETDFLVYFEGHTPRVDDEDGEDDEDHEDDEDDDDDARASRSEARKSRDERRSRAAKALDFLRRESAREPLYAVLDAARDDRILVLLRESVEAHRSLYEGVGSEGFEDVAPYLAGPMEAGSRLLDRLVEEGWGRRWGIYVTSREPPREVRRHFRRFLMVELEDSGERVYFRFFDPFVLRSFSRVCTPMQSGQLLSGLGQIWMEDDEGIHAFA